MESPRWNIITPSQYEWERRGLDFIKTGLPDHDPYRAWANFEFQTGDGAIYEVDLLVLTKQGFWLVECKAWGGRIWGDTGTWTRSQDGKIRSEDNPVLLANRKAKALSSLLKAQPAVSKVRLPWLDALVFLSTDDVQCDLTGNARNRVLLTDRLKTEHGRNGRASCGPHESGRSGHRPLNPRAIIDIRVAKALSRAMEQVGIRPSQRSRRIGDYILGDLIFDGPGYQDRLAKHASFERRVLSGAAIHGRPGRLDGRHARSSSGRQLVSSRSSRRWNTRTFCRFWITRSTSLARPCLFGYPDPDRFGSITISPRTATNSTHASDSNSCGKSPTPFDTPIASG